MANKWFKAHYSGNKSRGFWLEISKIKNQKERDLLYSAGVMLQEFESTVLKIMNLRRKK